MDIKITQDNFVWKVLTPIEARALWLTNAFEIYILYDDDSEGLIQTEEELNEAINDYTIGIEVGFIN